MTSSLSSVNTLRCGFVQTLKKMSFHSVLLFALLTPLFGDLHDLYRSYITYLEGHYTYNAVTNYTFALNRHVDSVSMGYLCLVVGFSAMFMALHCWRFMHVKKTVNVWFSLGVTRTNLFLSRYLACAVLLIAPVLLIFAGLLIGNLIIFGSTPSLWTATVLYALTFIAIALFSFAVTTFSMCLSGASIESFLCAGCLIAFPAILFFATESLGILFLNGAPFEHAAYDILSGEIVINGMFAPNGMFLNFFAPVTYYEFYRGFEATVADGWHNPGFSYPLFWLAAGAVMSMLSFLCFKRYKTENAAFLGKNPLLVGVSCLSLSYLLVFPAYLLCEDTEISKNIVFFIAIILFAVYFIVMSILLRNRKKVKSILAVDFAVCAVFLISCAAFATGGLGYETRIPAKEDIVSVCMPCNQSFRTDSYSFSENFINMYYFDDYTYGENVSLSVENFYQFSLDYGYYGDYNVLSDLTDEEDIDTALAVHQMLIEADEDARFSFFSPVALQYTLKDGTKFMRFYDYSTPAVSELLSKYKSIEAVQNGIRQDIGKDSHDALTLFAPAASRVTILPETRMENFSYELGEALCSDLKDGTLPIETTGTQAPIGYISLASNIYIEQTQEEIWYDEDGEEWHNDLVETTMMHATAVECSVGDEITFSDPTSFTLKEIDELFTYFDANCIYPVFADMTATLAVLAEYDLLQYLEATAEPVRALLVRTPFADIAAQTGINRSLLYRNEYFVATFTGSESNNAFTFGLNGAITQEADEIEQLYKGSFFRYPVTRDGSIVIFEYADGTTVQTYVPVENIPENLR